MAGEMKNSVGMDFDKYAEQYQKDSVSVTRGPAKYLLSLANPPITSSSVVLDLACGPGVATGFVLESLDGQTPPEIHAVDNAAGMITAVQKQNWPTVTAAVMDGQNLSFEDNKFTHVFSTFGIFMFPDSQKGIVESLRVLKEGGWFGTTSWNDLPWVEPATAAWARFKPESEELKFPIPPRWRTVEDVKGRLEEAGLKDINVHLMDNPIQFKSCEEKVMLMTPMLKQVLRPLAGLSSEEMETYSKVLVEEMKKVVVDKGDHVEAKTVAVVAYGTK